MEILYSMLISLPMEGRPGWVGLGGLVIARQRVILARRDLLPAATTTIQSFSIEILYATLISPTHEGQMAELA